MLARNTLNRGYLAQSILFIYYFYIFIENHCFRVCYGHTVLEEVALILVQPRMTSLFLD